MADPEESAEAKQPRRQPMLFGANPRINFTRLGWGGWLVLLGLLAVACIFYRYTLGALYFALAGGAYGLGWGLDRLFSGVRYADAPWIGWVVWGCVLGGVIGFCAIAPVYGLRRWRWALVGAVVAGMVGVALLPVDLPAGPDPRQMTDSFGPVVRVGGHMEVRRGGLVTLRFRVFDQSERAKVHIVIDQRGGRTFATIRVGSVPTGQWCAKDYRCRLRPGKYRYTIIAVDTKGQRAVHDGRSSLRVKGR